MNMEASADWSHWKIFIEELVGEIDSEMRQEELPLKRLNENHYRIVGAYSLAEFNESFQSDLPENDYDTVGGYVFGLFGRIPRSGESTTVDRFKFRVEKMKGSRILSLFLTLMSPPATSLPGTEKDEASRRLMDFATTLILVLLGILLEAFFSGSEIGMVSVNRIKMKHLAEDGSSAARSILKLLENPERLFTTTSLGTNLAMVASTAVFTAFMVTHFGDSGEWMAMMIISPLIFFVGEIIPKIIFQHRADSVMLFMIYPLFFFYKILSPFTSWLSKTSAKFTNRVQLASTTEHKTFSRDQLRGVLSLESQTVDLGANRKENHSQYF